MQLNQLNSSYNISTNTPIIKAIIEASILGLFSISNVPFPSIKIPGNIIAGKTAGRYIA